MQAISGTRRALKEMADGTIRVQIDIDPACRKDFLAIFGDIDMPVALAPLRADFERHSNPVESHQDEPKTRISVMESNQTLKGGSLAKLAGMFSGSQDFQTWCKCWNEAEAAEWIRKTCGVTSRAELDHSSEAEEKFHRRVRIPFMERAK